MNRVSGITNGKFYSAYLSVRYRPSEDRSNKDLNTKSVTLLTWMARADADRSERNIVNLQKSFLEALNECKTEEEKQNFAKFLYELAKIGGYAVEFYKANISLVTRESKTNAAQKETKKTKVSSDTSGKVESAYLNIKYRPKGMNVAFRAECNSLLFNMAMADISRNDYLIDAVMQSFCKLLSQCQTQAEFADLAKFMNVIADVGGYAVEFNNQVKNMINLEGRLAAIKYLGNMEKQKKAKSVDLEGFKKSFTRLNADFEELRASSVIDTDEVEYMLRTYKKLQTGLADFNGVLDKKVISRCNEQMEESINYLEKLSKDLEELKGTSVKF